MSVLDASLSPVAGGGSLLGARMAVSTAHKLVALAIVPMVAVTLWLALTSEHLDKPAAAGVYWSYLIAASSAVGLYWWIRRPGSRFGPLLLLMGLLTWVVSWQGADNPLLFDIGVLAEAPFFVLTFYLFLAFPMGRLEPRAARWLMGALVLGVLAFFLPWALFSPVIAGGGPLTRCAPACPENVLQIGSAPDVVEVAGKAETYTALTITLAVLIVYLLRYRSSSKRSGGRSQRSRVTSLLFLPAYFVYNFAAWILYLDADTLDTLAWGIVVTRILLPLGFLVALLQAGRFATTALRKLLERLAAHPTPERWRSVIAEAFDDDARQLGYHDPAAGRFREVDGTELALPVAAGRAWVPVEREGQPVAGHGGRRVPEPRIRSSCRPRRRPRCSPSERRPGGRAAGVARADPAGGPTRRGGESSAICTTVRSSASSPCGSTWSSRAGTFDRAEHREILERLGLEVDEAIDELRDVAHGLHPRSSPRRGSDRR